MEISGLKFDKRSHGRRYLMSAMGTRTSQYSGSYVCIKGLDR